MDLIVHTLPYSARVEAFFAVLIILIWAVGIVYVVSKR